MNFNYIKTETYMDSIDIEDIGNCYLSVMNDEAKEWYLKAETSLGWCDLTIFGPLTADDDSLGYSFTYSFSRFEYNGKKMFKIIDNFLNDPKKSITQVFILEEDDFVNRLESIKNNMN